MTVTRRSVLSASAAAPAAGALLGAPAAGSAAVDATHSLPAAIEAAVWDGRAWRTVRETRVDWATESGTPTVITFEPVRGSRIRLTMTSRYPDEPRGALRISRLAAPAA